MDDEATVDGGVTAILGEENGGDDGGTWRRIRRVGGRRARESCSGRRIANATCRGRAGVGAREEDDGRERGPERR